MQGHKTQVLTTVSEGDCLQLATLARAAKAVHDKLNLLILHALVS